jgi:HSP20 family protein
MRVPSGFGSSGFSSTFKTDVNDKGDHYEVVADLPGMDKAKIDVKAENGMLSINAQSETKKEQKEDNKVIRQERFIGSFHRSMSLPKDANEGKMTTEYKDGVLRIKIPKLVKGKTNV